MSRLIVNGGRKISRNNSKLIILSRALSSREGASGNIQMFLKKGRGFRAGEGGGPMKSSYPMNQRISDKVLSR